MVSKWRSKKLEAAPNSLDIHFYKRYTIGMNDYILYVCDTETTGIDPIRNDVIEVSFYRLSDEAQRTWCIKPSSIEGIEAAALKVNGHKYEDLTHQTKYGREVYGEASKVIIEIENWIAEDNISSDFRVLVGHNISYDKLMLQYLWNKCNSEGTFPFGRRNIDTMHLQFAMDYCIEELSPAYSLSALVKKYGVKNDKAHSAAADTVATKDVLLKQMAFLKQKLRT